MIFEDPSLVGFIARLQKRIGGLSSDPMGKMPDSEFNDFARELFRLQFSAVVPYRRLCESRGISPETVESWRDIPAVPAAAFKELELTALAPEERIAEFRSSGTTGTQPSRHFHGLSSLALYETALVGWFRRHVLGDWDRLAEEEVIGAIDRPGLLILTPPPGQAPYSSLVHMFGTAKRELGARDSVFTGKVGDDGGWELDMDATLFALRKSMCANRPVTLLGTAFSFVHLLDHFAANNIRYRLADGSRVMETGGYKGRSREMPRAELHSLITKHLGVPADRIVVEYGMSELNSQAYDRGSCADAGREVGDTSAKVLHFPPWVRVRFISPETGRDAEVGEPGLICIHDLANACSVQVIQTEDLGIARGEGFELLGRAIASEPRGCSLMPA